MSSFNYAHEDARQTTMMSVAHGDGAVAAGAFYSSTGAPLVGIRAWSASQSGPAVGLTSGVAPAHASQQADPAPALRAPPIPLSPGMYAPGPLPTGPAGRASSPAALPPSRRAARTSSGRARSSSPAPPAAADSAVEGASAPAAGADRDLSMHQVVDKVKRNFASVRAALTEQRQQSTDLARQMAVGMAKIDSLAVALEHAAAARDTDRNSLADVKTMLQTIVEELSKDNDGAPQEEPEDPDAWVGHLKVCLSFVSFTL